MAQPEDPSKIWENQKILYAWEIFLNPICIASHKNSSLTKNQKRYDLSPKPRQDAGKLMI